MYNPYNSRHFTTHVDPVSGVRIAVLTTRVAQVQQGIYYINNAYSDDGRYLWFMCNYPPKQTGNLAVIDFLTDEVYALPEVSGGGPLIDHRTGECYWNTPKGLYKRTPNPNDKAVKVADMPAYLTKMGVQTGATHLTFTPDYQELVADIQTKEGSVIGSYHLATGEFTEWYRTEPGTQYNHAQVNPIDKDVCMCAHEFKGELPPELIDGVYPRIQIITRDGKRTMIKPYKNFGGHEFWAPDGKSIYYENSAYRSFNTKELFGSEVGVVVQDMLDGSEPKVICEVNIPGGAGVWHVHCSTDQKYFVMDGAYPTGEFPLWRGCESTINFFNKETGKMFQFLTKNPVVEGYSMDNQCTYHIDPHPRFCLNDTLIRFTTTICGRVDFALVSTDQLIKATT